LITRLDAIIYDVKVVLSMPQKRDNRIVILDIDEKSLAEIGRWPWGRDKLATLVNNLFDKYQVAVLGFDAVFAERDDTSGLLSLESLANTQLKDSTAFQSALRDLRPQLDFDSQFAASLKGRKIALGYFMSSEDQSALGLLPQPVLPAGAFNGRHVDFHHYTGYGGNLEPLQKSAASAGFFNMVPDYDGSTRRVPMLVEYKGSYYESLSLAMMRQLLGDPKVVPGFPPSNKDYGAMEWIDLPFDKGAPLRIPVDETASSLVPFRGYQGSFSYVPAADVIAGRAKIEDLAHKIVILGTTAAGLKDLRVTPVGNVYPGVGVHANLSAGMLDGVIKYRPSYVLGADVVIMLLAGGVMVFLLPLLSASRSTIAAIIVLLLLLTVNFTFWQVGNLVLPLANSLTLVLLLYAVNMSWGYFVESRTKRQLTSLFGQYVPPELVEEMSRDPEN
jgi:adenylate cyclase